VTRGQNPDDGTYEVRPHMATGVVAIYYCERPGAVGQMVLTLGEAALPKVAEAIAKYMYRVPRQEQAPIRLVKGDEA
jgi:hypothetical protein